MQRIVKPKNQRTKRALEHRAPKLIEKTKTAMFVRGGRTSERVTQVLKELYMLKKPHAVMFKRKNILRPFDDQTSLEFFSNMNDASLFLFGSHSKKRPNNLVFGRTFDHQILDMIELGIDSFQSLRQFKNLKITEGTKPCLLFCGELFENDEEHRRLKSLLIDFFRGENVSNIRLAGLEHVICFTAIANKILMRGYRTVLKKSGCKTPRVELEEIGPSLNLIFRRTKLASDDLFKRASKQPKALKAKKKKNIDVDVFGTKHGRIHMQKQEISSLQTRKMKGLKRSGVNTVDDSNKKAKTDEGE
ncbi:ribosome production factor 2 homolog [Anneissia japonica]|uniref:ribosome production factor 2 homolog n=1 Tax=Anneissia japonica TaxID=1529436 RepID=UPI001425B8FE|nr:ribosome production factor 2 homolog [Anneissia japonica]